MSRRELVLSAVYRAVRGLRRSPGFTAAVVTTLALGVGANTAVFALVRHALLRPLSYPSPNELVAVGTSSREGLAWEVMKFNVDAWQRTDHALRTLAAVSWVRDRGRATVGASSAERVKGATAAANLLEVLHARPALGRWFTPDEERRFEPVVVLGHALWQRQFGGDASVVDRATLTVDDRRLTIIGVLPPGGGYPLDAEFWFPNPDNLSVEVVARARLGVSISDVQRELRALAPGIELNRQQGNPIDLVVMPLHERLYGANGPILRLLLGTVLLVLVLACTNVANLALARTLEQRRELAVCVALGASRWRLAAQVLAENAMLAAAGGAVGVVLARWVTGVLVRVSPAELPGVRGAAVGAGGVLFAAGSAMLAALAVTIASAFAVTHGDLRLTMGHPGALCVGGGSASRARSALVVVQFAVALLLVTASGLLIRSMVRLAHADTGFDRHGLVLAQLRLGGERYETVARRRALVDALVARLRVVPGVRAAAVGPPPLVGRSGPGFSEGYDNIVPVRDSTAPGTPSRSVWVKYVDPTYLETFRIRVRAGRGITPADDAGAPAVALVNAAAVRLFFPDGPALGRQLVGLPMSTAEATSGGRPITVVGLLPDVRQRDITLPAYPEIWLPLAQQDVGLHDVDISARTTGDPEALVRTVRTLIEELDPELEPRRLSTMDSVVRRTLAPERFVLAALGAFAALALVLAALGLYAVMAYLTAARAREIGVRIALGARPAQVLWMVLGRGLRLAAVGAVVGLPMAYAVSGVMARFVYDVDPRDTLTFVAAPMMLALAALAAVYVPARRATRVEPVIALRAD